MSAGDGRNRSGEGPPSQPRRDAQRAGHGVGSRL